jgi:itaconyl-CoA hydratase
MSERSERISSTVRSPDLSSFPTRRRGNPFEAFEPGRLFEHGRGKTVTAGDNSLFTSVTHAYNPLYLDAEAARADGHPDVVVNPLLVLCIVVGLSVEDLSEAGGPFLGLDGLTFHRPVYAGDTLTARSTVVDARGSRSRPGSGLVTWHTEGRNHRGELVVDYRRTNLVARARPPKEDAE